jgi:hypothetical protein
LVFLALCAGKKIFFFFVINFSNHSKNFPNHF